MLYMYSIFYLEIKKCVVKICGWLGVKPTLLLWEVSHTWAIIPQVPPRIFKAEETASAQIEPFSPEESRGAPSTWLPERERRLNGHHHKVPQIYHAGRGELWSDPGLGVAAFECHPHVRVCVTLGANFSKKFPPKIQVGGWCVSELASMDTSKSLGSQILSWEGKGDTTTERNPTP